MSGCKSINFYFVGSVDYDRWLSMQDRLVANARDHEVGQISLLFCEHPRLITIGRSGSRGDIQLDDGALRQRQTAIRWVCRGGPSIIHGPGQLAIYPIARLEPLAWSVGQFMTRFHRGILAALQKSNVKTETHATSHHVWGRGGILSAMGVAVRHGVVHHGAFLNVNPPMRDYSLVESANSANLPPATKLSMTCLLAEGHRPARMTTMRSTLVESLATAFECDNYFLQTNHPLLHSSTT
jgi:lipoyl(octanoyl) transferase